MRQTENDTIAMQTNAEKRARVTVYFDGACPLCSAEIGHYKAQAGGDQICFVDASQPDARLGPDLDAHAAMGRFHVRLPDGTLVSGARAFAAIWQTLPGWRWAARIARIPGVTPFLELGYRLFLPVRPPLSKVAAWFGARPMAEHKSGR